MTLACSWQYWGLCVPICIFCASVVVNIVHSHCAPWFAFVCLLFEWLVHFEVANNVFSLSKSKTHAHGPFCGTTQVSRYQKGKANLDFTEARDSEWHWHQLGHMQVCISLQTDNHASTSLDVCMGMVKTGIPWVPWDSHENGNKISHGMGMGIKCIGMGVKTWGWNSLLWIVFCSYIVTWSKGSNATAWDWASCAEMK